MMLLVLSSKVLTITLGSGVLILHVFSRYEIETLMNGRTKWDRAGFCGKNKKLMPAEW